MDWKVANDARIIKMPDKTYGMNVDKKEAKLEASAILNQPNCIVFNTLQEIKDSQDVFW